MYTGDIVIRECCPEQKLVMIQSGPSPPPDLDRKRAAPGTNPPAVKSFTNRDPVSPHPLTTQDPSRVILCNCTGTSLMRNCLLSGPYSRPMSRALRWSQGGEMFLMSDEPL